MSGSVDGVIAGDAVLAEEEGLECCVAAGAGLATGVGLTEGVGLTGGVPTMGDLVNDWWSGKARPQVLAEAGHGRRHPGPWKAWGV